VDVGERKDDDNDDDDDGNEIKYVIKATIYIDVNVT